jgi:hypothetical protein
MADEHAERLSKSQQNSQQTFAPHSGRVQACLTCGRRLPASRATGRPRLTCSQACRRRRDFAARKVRRRELWLAQWHRLAQLGQVPRRDLRREVRNLRQDIDALKQQVQPRQPDDEPA